MVGLFDHYVPRYFKQCAKMGPLVLRSRQDLSQRGHRDCLPAADQSCGMREEAWQELLEEPGEEPIIVYARKQAAPHLE